ncbi:MAG TPA: lipoyl(octanoyl) transferase LipB [Bacteroidales bacterium]|nr:lipoyl(octanoyl) transferase LipB [Bacteroidales bacterium]
MIQTICKDLGKIDYQEAWDYQKTIFSEVLENKQKNIPLNYFLLCEHPHVYTLGKSGSENNLLIDYIQLQAKDATFYKIDRGGDITYHGPGQIVGYPIIDLETFNLSVKNYVFNIEEVIINTLKALSIQSERLEGATGVWIEPNSPKARKICAIGIKASRYITMHGFAFNVNTDLSYFNYINPCGFTDKSVTSLEKELGEKQDFEKIKELVKDNFSKVFKTDLMIQ